MLYIQLATRVAIPSIVRGMEERVQRRRLIPLGKGETCGFGSEGVLFGLDHRAKALLTQDCYVGPLGRNL